MNMLHEYINHYGQYGSPYNSVFHVNCFHWSKTWDIPFYFKKSIKYSYTENELNDEFHHLRMLHRLKTLIVS